MIANHKENGTECGIDDAKNLEKADTQFSVPRVHCPEERSTAEEVENYQYTSALMGWTIEIVFRTMISVNQAQYLRSSLRFVWRIQSWPRKNGRFVLAGQSDPLFVPTSTLMETPTLLTDDPAFYKGNIRLKERPASSGYGTQKRNISEVLSDHSLSSWTRNHLRSLVPATPLAHHHEVTWWALASSSDCHTWGEFEFHPLFEFHVSFSITNIMCIMSAWKKNQRKSCGW